LFAVPANGEEKRNLSMASHALIVIMIITIIKKEVLHNNPMILHHQKHLLFLLKY
jgi:hypothetical protein